MFLKRKRNGKMKGRGCADGRPQREHISKEELLLPTVSIYALFGSCVIDALDERSVITIDKPGAFLQGIWPQDQHPGYLNLKEWWLTCCAKLNRHIKNTSYIKKSRDPNTRRSIFTLK